MTVKCVTDHPVAFESPDHLCPVGTKNDNSTHGGYIGQVEKFFEGKNINYMDLGCAGGQLVVDLSNRGHFAVGVEGSDTGRKHKLFNWPQYDGTVLHTADITKPFHIERDGEKVEFDMISAWEVVEHIHPMDLDAFFENILSNLKTGGFFVASINLGPDVRVVDGVTHHLHQSVFPENVWRERVLSKYCIEPYPFRSKVRDSSNSFYIKLVKE